MNGLKKRADVYVAVALVILGVVLIGLLFLFSRQYLALRRAKVLNDEVFWHSLAHRPTPLPTTQAVLIQDWMTFSYVNRLFDLPPAYLETVLKISDPHYPQITLYRYAVLQKLGPAAFTAEVQNAVRDHSPQS